MKRMSIFSVSSVYASSLPDYGELSNWADWLGSFKFADADLGEVISTLLPYIFAIAGLGLLLYLLLSGFKLMTGGGSPENIARGQKMITNAVVGFVIVIISYWIVQILSVIFNFSFLNPPTG